MSRTSIRHRRNAAGLRLSLLVLGIAIAALFTSYQGWSYYLELLSHFQAQYFISALFLLGCIVLTRCQQRFLGLALLGCALLSLQIFPWYLSSQRFLPKPPVDLTIFVANINTNHQSYDLALSAVREEQPDIAIFIEVDRFWVEQLNQLSDQLPYSFGRPEPGRAGLMVYSRQPLENPEIRHFSPDSNFSIIGEYTSAGRSFTLIAIHPLAPTSSESFRLRNLQLQAIATEVSQRSGPVIVAGDFNTTQWSPYFRDLIKTSQLRNSRLGFGVLPTWPVRSVFNELSPIAPLIFPIPIDHCLISQDFETIDMRTGQDTGSDHRPIVADLNWRSNQQTASVNNLSQELLQRLPAPTEKLLYQ